MNEKGLGKHLQAMRRSAGLTQQALCQKAGLSFSTVAKIERGAIKAPSIFTVADIAAALQVSLDELIGQTDKSKPEKQRQRSKSGVQFVYFDINGTLVRSYHRAFTRLAETTNQPTDQVETAFWHYNDQVNRGDITMAEFNRALADRLHTKQKIDWQSYYMQEVEVMPQMQELLRWVGARYGVGLLTNIMPGLVKLMLRGGLLPDVDYDAVIDSSEVRTIKPEPKIYQLAAERADCPASQLLLIDDTRANLTAAEKAGWHVIWFDGFRPQESGHNIRAALEN
ncbi:MAG: HAD-IA family hydrolase [Candidatus Saccharimonadales bacterium]